MMASRPQDWIDRSALTLSGLCLIHCLAGSLLLALLSVGGGLLSHSVHAVGFAFALPLAAFGLWRGTQRHGRRMVLLLGSAGLALMAMSLWLSHGHLAEIAASVTGVALLGMAHLLNLRWSRRATLNHEYGS